MGCTPSILSSSSSSSEQQNRKDSGLFCGRIGIGGNNSSNIINNGNDTTQSNTICNQILVNSYSSRGDNCGVSGYVVGEKDNAYTKKDSIVSVTGIGHLTGFTTVQTVLRRNTGSGTSSVSGRLGHRKSSLALTPEEEPLDTSVPPINELIEMSTNVCSECGRNYSSSSSSSSSGCLDAIYSIFNKPLKNSNKKSIVISSNSKNNKNDCTVHQRSSISTLTYRNSEKYFDNFVLTSSEINTNFHTNNICSNSSYSTHNHRSIVNFDIVKNENEIDEEYEMRKKDVKVLTNDSGCYSDDTISINIDDDNSNHSDMTTNDMILYELDNNNKSNDNTKIITSNYNSNIIENEENMNEAKNLNNIVLQKIIIDKNKTACNLDEDDDDGEDDENELRDIVLPLPRRRSAVDVDVVPDLDELISQLDTDTLRLNELIVENDSNGEQAIYIKHSTTRQQTGFRPRTFAYERKQSSNSTTFGSLMNIEEEDDYDFTNMQNNSFSNKKQLTDVKFPSLLPPNPCLRVLLAFPKNDNVSDAILNACQRLNFEVKECKTTTAASELFQNSTIGGQHIIVVDGRHPKSFDPEIIGRSIRSSKGSQHTIMVAVLKKSTFEKDDTAILSLLDAGYNRCFVESPHLSICSSELRQIQHSLVRPQNVISTQQALYTALNRSREPMIITDDLLRTQYSNKATERLLNMRLDEIVGRPLAELLNTDVTPITMQTNRHREYDGVLPIKRKTQETVSMHLRATPVICVGRNPTHLVITIDLPCDPMAVISSNKEAPRGSLHSIRRGSFDVRSIASDGLRRTSLAKLSSLPLEAPITKVVTLLSQVQENCSPDEAKLLDKVMEFLKREGLYSPQMKEIRTDDPVANDLIGALLLQGPSSILSSRRSSNDSIIRTSRTSTSITPVKMKGSSQLTDLLNKSLDWDFDIFKLEEITEKRPLLYLGMELLRRFDFFNSFNIDETTVKSWLVVIEAHYHSTNTYHNSTHAADVMQATGAFLQQLSVKELNILDRMEEASSLIAAATHDIDHPGRSSAFLCNSDNPLAILYNDTSVLESHHTATTFRLTLADDKINIFKNLDKESYKLARMVIIDMILATEMTKHFEHLAKFVSVFGTDVEGKEIIHSECDDNEILIRRMLIKCADVSNPTRPLSYCVEWARRIAEEYFTQTDEEKRRNLPIVMPMFDRATCSISKSQIGFIEYIIQDMIQAWDGFIDMPELMQYMQYNYTQWKLFEQQGIHTLNDIEIKQSTLTSELLL